MFDEYEVQSDESDREIQLMRLYDELSEESISEEIEWN